MNITDVATIFVSPPLSEVDVSNVALICMVVLTVANTLSTALVLAIQWGRMRRDWMTIELIHRVTGGRGQYGNPYSLFTHNVENGYRVFCYRGIHLVCSYLTGEVKDISFAVPKGLEPSKADDLIRARIEKSGVFELSGPLRVPPG